MANPLLNEKSMKQAAQRGWAASEADAGLAKGAQTTIIPPLSDGPVSPWGGTHAAGETMTASGAATATLTLLALLVGAATFGWSLVSEPVAGQVQFPAWIIAGVLIGLVCAVGASFRPQYARVLGPVYAIAEGVVVGAVSRVYSIEYSGIVVQAVGATLGVFVAMLVMYRTGIIRVNDKFRRVVMSAMVGLLIFYGVSFLFNLLGANITFFKDASLLGIGFSIFVAGLAAANLALDFDFIERGEKEGLPKQMEWYAALGVVVTLVWLYLEILRLLSKLRDR
ncbi:MAG: Bax inhibitor-1/YccA family protein [Actinomycetes bacterium]